MPIGLEHLDLEILVQFEESYHDQGHTDQQGRDYMSEWRQNLQHLYAAQDTPLGIVCGGGRTRENIFGLEGLCIDRLLVSPDDQSSRSTFPCLKSISLYKCTLNVSNFKYIATTHQATFRGVDISRVTFSQQRSNFIVGSWSEVGAFIKEILPNLIRLRLAKLVTRLEECPLDRATNNQY